MCRNYCVGPSFTKRDPGTQFRKVYSRSGTPSVVFVRYIYRVGPFLFFWKRQLGKGFQNYTVISPSSIDIAIAQRNALVIFVLGQSQQPSPCHVPMRPALAKPSA